MSVGGRKAVDLSSYLERTGNHSTKPRKTGDNSILAERTYDIEYKIEEEKKEARMRQELSINMTLASSRLAECRQKIAAIKESLTVTMPGHVYREVMKKRAKVVKEIIAIESELSALKLQRKGFTQYSETRFERVFMDAAQRILPTDVFQAIRGLAMELQRIELKGEHK